MKESMDARQQIAELLREAKIAHGQAFAEVGGEDADWADWYAGFVGERLNRFLRTNLSRGELAQRIEQLAQQYDAVQPEQPWPEYYAAQLATGSQ